jgi:hypothetical protein
MSGKYISVVNATMTVTCDIALLSVVHRRQILDLMSKAVIGIA